MVKVQTTTRASSAQADNVARTIVKRRDKPYKTEQSRVLEKKRKLQLQVRMSAGKQLAYEY